MVNKRKKLNIFLLFVFAVLCVSTAGAQAVKIMPLGDSITGSPGCWRALLYTSLADNGYTNIDFVGTLGDPGCGIEYDGDNEGHGGYLATGIVENDYLPGWLDATNPDMVMLFLGTNDTWNSKGTSSILRAFSTLLQQMRDNNPNMIVIVAQIPPNNYDGCDQCTPNIIDLNAAIPGWAGDNYTEESPIIVVDLFTGFDTTTDTYDGCHPNDSGNVKLADNWYPVLAGLLDGVVPSPAPTSLPNDCTDVPEWNAETTYDVVGSQVVHNGILYELNYYSLGQDPSEFSDAFESWTYIGECDIYNSTPSPTPTATPDLLLGDVNSSGGVDIVDALMTAQYYVGLAPAGFNPDVADVNCDGAVTIVDALMIAQYYVGLISELC